MRLERIHEINRQLAAMPEDHPERFYLEQEKAKLKRQLGPMIRDRVISVRQNLAHDKAKAATRSNAPAAVAALSAEVARMAAEYRSELEANLRDGRPIKLNLSDPRALAFFGFGGIMDAIENELAPMAKRLHGKTDNFDAYRQQIEDAQRAVDEFEAL